MTTVSISRLALSISMAKQVSAAAALLTLVGCATTQSGVSLRRNGSAASAVTDESLLPTREFSMQLSPTDKVRVRVLPLQVAGTSSVFEPEDTLSYHFSLSAQDYHIMSGDELVVHFGADSKLDATVTVRPDGRITLSDFAELPAAGKSPAELSNDINEAYRARVNQPASSVTVTKSNLSLAEISGDAVVQSDGTIAVPKIGQFKAAGETPSQLVSELSQAASKRFGNTLNAEVTRTKAAPTTATENRHIIGFDSVVAVASDSRLLLPEIGYIDTTGKTVAQVQMEIETALKVRFPNPLAVQVALESSDSRVAYVDGEVGRPGAYPVTYALTMLKAVSLAGGILDTGSLKQVILIHRNEHNDVFVYVTNLNEFIEKGVKANDLAVTPQDIVVVPRTTVAKADQWIDQYINRMLPFSRSVSYSYNRGDNYLH